ncbi:MAG: molybdopterin-dependent oxidoreductase [Thermodesulfobacteriota bacterium]|nr:molybdopterin-dependent oxidoreductase [Thermodesulfobacteriota bacterium]
MIKHSVCRLCSACCPITVEVENNRLMSAARKSVRPENRQIICPKLRAAKDIVYSDQRLQTPLIREEDGFRPAGWDEALDRVAGKMIGCRDQHGPQSVCWLRGMAADWGLPWDYANRLMNAFGSPNTIGNGSICHVSREFAHTYVHGALALPEIRNARCIVVWGKNDRHTNPGGAEAIYEACENGARLIVIDTVKTALARKADIFLQIHPGHDGLLAMAWIHEIISNDLYDVDFVKQWTKGFDELKRAAAAFPVDAVASRCGLAPELVRQAIDLYAKTRPACIVDGNGLDMQLEVYDATRAACMLRGLTGNIDKPGGDCIPQPLTLADFQLQDRLPPAVAPVTAGYPLYNTFHHNWGRQVQSTVVDAILDERPYPLKMLIVQSGNPLVTMMDAHRARRAFEKLDFLVVIDLFMTETAKMADVILPASSCFEKTQLNRAYIRNSPVMLQEAVIPPLHESRPDWDIVFDLGRRLGLTAEFPWQTAEAALDDQLAPAGITVDDLRAHPQGLYVNQRAYEKYKTGGFATPSGKFEFYSDRLANAGMPAIPFENGFVTDPISFEDQKDQYPLIGISGARDIRFNNSQFRQIPSLLKNRFGCHIDINAEDARQYGVENGDTARVSTPRGDIVMPVKFSAVTRPGIIRIAWGWGDLDPACSLNRLTDDHRRAPLTGTPVGRNFHCRIEKVEG